MSSFDDRASEDGGVVPSVLGSEDDGGGALPAIDHYNPHDVVSSWLQEAFAKEDLNETFPSTNNMLPKDVDHTTTFSGRTSKSIGTSQSLIDCEIAIVDFEPKGMNTSGADLSPSGVLLDQYPESLLKQNKQSRRTRFIIVASSVALVLALIALAIAIIIKATSSTNNEGTPDAPPIATFPPSPAASTSSPGLSTSMPSTTQDTAGPSTSMPSTTQDTAAPTSALVGELQDLISSLSFDSGLALSNQSSPQFLAFSWLASEPNLGEYSDFRKIQRYVLATLYFSTSGEDWKDADEWVSHEHECDWAFAEDPCGSFGEIVNLALGKRGLHGALPPELALLASLRNLDLSDNLISEPIPELTMLVALERLNLHNISFSGSISNLIQPSALGTMSNLRVLDLGDNNLTGTIPFELSLLSLYELDLSKNELKGSIPDLGSMTTLEKLYLDGNDLKGSISVGICQLGISGITVDCGEVFCSCCSNWCLYLSLSALSTDSGSALADGASPQHMAFDWLTRNPNLKEYRQQQVLQRYALAVLFYSTSGEEWDDRYEYLDDVEHECAWVFPWDYSPSLTPVTDAPSYTAAPLPSGTDAPLPPQDTEDSLQVETLAPGTEAAAIQVYGKAASSSRSQEYSPPKATDGDLMTFWQSEGGGNQWIALYLGFNYILYSIQIYWGDEFALTYQVETSENGKDWTLIFLEDAGAGGIETIDLESNVGRYLRVYATQSASEAGGYSVSEIKLLGMIKSARALDMTESCDANGNLLSIILEDNELEGTIPEELGLLRTLQVLDLSKNKIEGSVPSQLCSLNLSELRVDCAEVECDCCPLCQ